MRLVGVLDSRARANSSSPEEREAIQTMCDGRGGSYVSKTVRRNKMRWMKEDRHQPEAEPRTFLLVLL